MPNKYVMYVFGIHKPISAALASRTTEHRTNNGTESQKNAKILPFYHFYTKAWPKIQKLWVNPKKCEPRKKTIPIRFTKVSVKIMPDGHFSNSK